LTRVLGSIAAALLLLALSPAEAWAWSPGTHILLGEAVLGSASTLLPATIAALLREFPQDFLYGSIAADTSFAKRYARVGRHCHYWHVGEEILDRARDEPLQAFAWGYLAHLAADVVAHNHFVPHQLAITSSSSGAGHSYWESRFEMHSGEQWARRARDIILLDHRRADGHLDRILSPTLFSTSTNRRIFRSMVHVTDSGSWQRVMTLMAERSRWSLRDATVHAHLERSFDYIVDFLVRGAQSVPHRHDPSGEHALRDAKRLRREALGAGGERVARREAAERFGLAPEGLGWVERAPAGLRETLQPATRTVDA
jgi:hypothetical protein